MPSPWANLVVGGAILPDSYFREGFRADFTKPLDGGVNAGGILGTTPGFSGDPFNFTYPTDGQFKVGGHLHFHQNYATGYNHPFASDQRNKEPQYSPHFHGGGDPNPMSFFEVRDGKFILKARKLTMEEQSWGRIKGFAIMENGREATYGWFAQNGGVPMDWAPGSPTGGDTELVYFFNMPAQYAAPMISTYNRASMSFGRSVARVIMPSGAKLDGNIDDLRNIEVWFPACWDLEDVPAKCDLNGRISSSTSTPGNPGAGGVLTELDQAEIFGYEQLIHITSHHYKDGNTGFVTTENNHQVRKSKRIQTNHTPPYPAVRAFKGQYFEPGVDRFPPYQGEPGVICYHVNGIIHALYEMPRYMGEPKIIYDPVPEVPWLPQLNEDFTVKRLGSQTYAENGQPAYMHMCQIYNIAMSAGFVRRQARSSLDGSGIAAPTFTDTDEMHIEWTRMDPLIDENPDSRPFIDYRAGEFGGSGETVGEIYESGTVPGDVTPKITDPDIEQVGTATYRVIATRPNGKQVLAPTYVGDAIADVISDGNNDDGIPIDAVSRSRSQTNLDKVTALESSIASMQLQIAMLIDKTNWNLIENSTTQIKADLYRIDELTAPVIIDNHTIQDKESVRIIDNSAITATFPVTLNFTGTIFYNFQGTLQQMEMPLILDTGIVDVLLIRTGDNWRLHYNAVENT